MVIMNSIDYEILIFFYFCHVGYVFPHMVSNMFVIPELLIKPKHKTQIKHVPQTHFISKSDTVHIKCLCLFYVFILFFLMLCSCSGRCLFL